MILSSQRTTTSRNASATLAFQQSLKQKEEAEIKGDRLTDEIKVVVDKVDQITRPGVIETRHYARLQILAVKGKQQAKEITIAGPRRRHRPEAVLDGLELGQAYEADGEAGCRRAALKLPKTVWPDKDVKDVNEKDLEGFGIVDSHHQVASQPKGLPQKLIPPGEGWTRHDDDILVNVSSQIFFVQSGKRAGKYLKRLGAGFEQVEQPHKAKEFPVTVRATNACWIRKGAKLDRVVLLPDIPKIARLALKFPLSFVDLPACAFALFQGHRSADAAQWCAENFHKKLLPKIAEKIHTWQVSDLEQVLRSTLEALDAELLKSASTAFSGCSALVALLLGEQVVVAGVGHVRAVLLPQKGGPSPLLACTGSLGHSVDCIRPEELERIRKAGADIRDGALFQNYDGDDAARRILTAKHAFEVLQIEAGGPTDDKQVRSAYKKFALKVHPDKAASSADPQLMNAAFQRLEEARETLENMFSKPLACRELHEILRATDRGEICTRAGAACILGIAAGAEATVDTDAITAEAKQACQRLKRKLEDGGLQAFPDCKRACAMLDESVETLSRGCGPEALRRHETLLREGLPTSRAMGARDLRLPYGAVAMQPEVASCWLSRSCQLGLLCGPTASLSDAQLAAGSLGHRFPKATALRWCLDTGEEPISSAVCVGLTKMDVSEPAAKRVRVAAADGTVRVRHILFKHGQLRQPDPMARRDGVAKTQQEAEEAALRCLEKLLKANTGQLEAIFPRMVRELSDCQTAGNPGNLAGDLGWIGQGNQEPAFDDVVFKLNPKELGDIVTTSRGIHVIQRLA